MLLLVVWALAVVQALPVLITHRNIRFSIHGMMDHLERDNLEVCFRVDLESHRTGLR
jgi:hypothetical protein